MPAEDHSLHCWLKPVRIRTAIPWAAERVHNSVYVVGHRCIVDQLSKTRYTEALPMFSFFAISVGPNPWSFRALT